MENLVLTRIDDRLIHGQVMTAWIKQKNAVQVVVADDEVAEDDFMINVLEMAVPDEIAIGIFNRDDAVEFMKQGLEAPTILLVKGPEILNYMVDQGIEIDEIDVGGMGAKEGRSVLYKNISTNPEENKNFLDLIQKGVNVFVQVMPQDKQVNVAEYIKITSRNLNE